MKSIFSRLALLAVAALVLSGCTLIPSRKKAALSVDTNPRATIFLDGEHLGQTPYLNDSLKAGEYVLKIVPESSGQALFPWEGRITLSPGILTAVQRELGLTQDSSSGQLLSFEPIADKNAVSISVVTTPDAAVVYLDGEPRGNAPISLDNLTEGDHVLLITATGYQDKTIKAKTAKGFKLVVNVQLARETVDLTATDEPEATPSASPKTSPSPSPKASASPTASPSPKASPAAGDPAKPFVTINSAGTGWARVREVPGGAEVAKVDHGTKYTILETQAQGGYDWYQIEYDTGEEGWVREDVVTKTD